MNKERTKKERIKKLRIPALLLIALTLLCPQSARAEEAGEQENEAPSENAAIEWSLPEEQTAYTYRLTDGYTESYIAFKKDEICVLRPQKPCMAITLTWYQAPAQYEVSQLDAAGTSLSAERVTDEFVVKTILLTENCASLSIAFTEAGALAEVRAVDAAETLPADVQLWSPSPEHADLVVLAAETGAEWKYFGAVLPTYASERGVKTAVVYLSDYDKPARRVEALNGLWRAGVREYPIFLPFTCKNFESYEMLTTDRKQAAVTDTLTELLSALSPRVVVTHGLTGEGWASHRFFAECALAAIESTGADKLYFYAAAIDAAAIDAEARTVVPMDAPLNAFHGQTAKEIAQDAFSLHLSQSAYGLSVATDGGFSLAYSSVGADAAKDDLLEHIDVGALIVYAPVTPTPSPTPALTPTPTPTETPPALPTHAENGTQTAAGSQNVRLGALLIGVGGSLLLLVAAYRPIRKRRGGGDALCVCLLPLAIGAVVFTVLYARGNAATETEAPPAPAATEIVAAAETPLPERTPADTEGVTAPVTKSEAKPTAAPSPEELAEAGYFRAADEPAEVIEYDDEHGYWSYKSDLLGITIERVETTTAADKPLTYFVADIHMKNVYQLRPAFGSDAHSGRGAILPWLIARRARAVLWITGDNLINDEREEKGILIRDGILFASANKEDTLAIYPDMTMRILKKNIAHASEMLGDGVVNSFSFGPTLLENGEVNPNAWKHRVRRANPRAGVGYVSAGHYIAIVVDGRQKDYSVGLEITEFAELFRLYDCELAYNLDGGLSAAMLFMGEQINSHAGVRNGKSNDISYQRRVPDGIIFGWSAQVPDENAPLKNNGNQRLTGD